MVLGSRGAEIGFLSGRLDGGGGLERHELALASGLAHRGWKVRVLYRGGGDLVEAWGRFAQLDLLVDEDLPQALAALRGVRAVYTHDPDRFSLARAVAESLKVPDLVHLHVPPAHLRPGLKGRLKGRHRQRMDPAVFSRRSRVARYVAVSHHTRREWVRSGLPAARIEVVHNGVDLNRYRPATDGERAAARAELDVGPNRWVAGFVGRIDPLKGITELLDAAEAIGGDGVPITVLVVGDATRHLRGSGLVDALRERSQGDVRWLGRRNDVDQLYRAMDAVAVPSRWDEPVGLVAIESLACGIPVVTSGRGGLREIFTGPLESCITPPTAPALATRFRELYADPAASRQLGQLGRREVERRFDMETNCDRVDVILREMCGLPAG